MPDAPGPAVARLDASCNWQRVGDGVVKLHCLNQLQRIV